MSGVIRKGFGMQGHKTIKLGLTHFKEGAGLGGLVEIEESIWYLVVPQIVELYVIEEHTDDSRDSASSPLGSPRQGPAFTTELESGMEKSGMENTSVEINEPSPSTESKPISAENDESRAKRFRITVYGPAEGNHYEKLEFSIKPNIPVAKIFSLALAHSKFAAKLKAQYGERSAL
ncbi:hypothetical protein V5O48_003791 [Marasmius crinis-equi]|uniref:Uncharacterized protein n=1 Tax=Marasmius crinis-equi TaxID=585013 RepID=A0ABR3FSN9_9AGAR